MTTTTIPRTAEAGNSILLGDAGDSLGELFDRTLREGAELELL